MDTALPNSVEVWLDTFNSKDNVVFVTSKEIAIGSFPFSLGSSVKILEEEKKFFEQSAEDARIPNDKLDFVIVPFEKCQLIKYDGRKGKCELHYEENGRKVTTCAPFLNCHDLQFIEVLKNRVGPNWEHESRSVGRIGPVIRNFAMLLVTAGITLLLYLGIENGVITRGPAWLATIVLFLGTTGVLAIGGLLSLVWLLLLLGDLIKPASAVEMRPKPSLR